MYNKIDDSMIQMIREAAVDAIYCNVNGNVSAAIVANRKLIDLRKACEASGCSDREFVRLEMKFKSNALRGVK
jgi:hypothetical protein